jgi:hypothetical protein
MAGAPPNANNAAVVDGNVDTTADRANAARRRDPPFNKRGLVLL